MEAREALSKKQIPLTDEAVAEATGLSVEKVAELRSIPSAYPYTSLTTASENGRDMIENHAGADDKSENAYRRVEAREDIKAILNEEADLLEMVEHWVNELDTKPRMTFLARKIRERTQK